MILNNIFINFQKYVKYLLLLLRTIGNQSSQSILINNAAFWGVVPFIYADSKIVLLKSKWLILRWRLTLISILLIRFLLLVEMVMEYFSNTLDLSRYIDQSRLIFTVLFWFFGIFDLHAAWMCQDIASFYNSSWKFYVTYLSKLSVLDSIFKICH